MLGLNLPANDTVPCFKIHSSSKRRSAVWFEINVSVLVANFSTCLPNNSVSAPWSIPTILFASSQHKDNKKKPGDNLMPAPSGGEGR